MILTVTGVVVLTIGLLSLALALYGGYVSASIIEPAETSHRGDEQGPEKMYYLLSMIGLIVLFSRLVNAPLFFWLLQSMVPYLPSAMCAYGVVNAGSPYSVLALLSKIILPVFYGVWLVFDFANRGQPRLPLMGTLAKSFLLLLLPLVLFDSVVDILFVVSLQPIDVPCCSSIYAIDPPFSPSYIFGPAVSFAIIVGTISLLVCLIAIQLIHNSSNRAKLLIIGLSLLTAILYVTLIHDVMAPLILGLPTHHCPYCLFQEFPDTALFAGLFWLGVSATVWRVSLEFIWIHYDLDMIEIQALVSMLRKTASVSLLFSSVSLLSHLFALI